MNWSPALWTSVGSLQWLITEVHVSEGDPVFVGLHVVAPRVGYTNQGKTQAAFPQEIHDAVRDAVVKVTDHWRRARERDRKDSKRIADAKLAKLKQQEKAKMSAKAASWKVMVEAHAHVTGGEVGAPAGAR
jgi:DNA topoisomerase VI subunit B